MCLIITDRQNRTHEDILFQSGLRLFAFSWWSSIRFHFSNGPLPFSLRPMQYSNRSDPLCRNYSPICPVLCLTMLPLDVFMCYIKDAAVLWINRSILNLFIFPLKDTNMSFQERFTEDGSKFSQAVPLLTRRNGNPPNQERLKMQVLDSKQDTDWIRQNLWQTSLARAGLVKVIPLETSQTPSETALPSHLFFANAKLPLKQPTIPVWHFIEMIKHSSLKL